MARGRAPGTKNRNYPQLSLEHSLRVARAIQDDASGMPVSRLTLAELVDSTPTSRVFRELVSSSRSYGLTTGGINSDEFALTELGDRATGGDEVAQVQAYKEAALSVPPYGTFFKAFNGKKVPSPAPFRDFLMKESDIDESRVDECISRILEDASLAGLIRSMKGGDWVDLEGVPVAPPAEQTPVLELNEPHAEDVASDPPEARPTETDARPAGGGHRASSMSRADAVSASGPKKVFIAHGKNRVPLDQLKKALDQFKVKYAVAVDEPNRGRPISKKVAELMENECSSGIFIFTADERFLREDEQGQHIEVWRPSENVVYELGAASILYENRIVIFKEKSVSFPSDFSDLGYISFEKDQLVAELGALFAELVALDVLEVRAKG